MPALVHVTEVLATPASSFTVTIPATTAGNCLVVIVQGENSSGTASVTAMKLGGSADNFGVLKSVEKADSLNSIWTDVVAWADPACAGSQTSVVISLNANWASALAIDVTVFEVSGLASTLLGLLDQFSTGTGASTAYSSGSAPASTQAAEFWVGAAYAANGITTLPSSPWTDSGINVDDGNAGCGYQITTSTGTALYSGSAASGTVEDWAALTLALFPGAAAAAAAPPALPLIPPGRLSPMAFGFTPARQPAPHADSDIGTATESASVAVSDSDTGSGADSQSVTQGASDSDAGSAAEASTTAATLAAGDTGTGADSSVISATLASSDTGTAAESASVIVQIPVGSTDAGTGVDAESVSVKPVVLWKAADKLSKRGGTMA